jgi:hypothetical protein
VAGDILPAGSGLDASDGDFFALVSTGPGSTASVGDLTSDTFTVTAAGGTLSFDYDFLTSEIGTGDFYDPEFDGLDAFLVQLLPTVGAPIALLSGDITNTDFDFFGSYDVYDTPNLVVFDQHISAQGSLLSFSTAVAAGDYRLRFVVVDGPVDGEANDEFDSALLIDNVLLVNNPIIEPPDPGLPPVPEPTTLLLFGVAGALALVRRRG